MVVIVEYSSVSVVICGIVWLLDTFYPCLIEHSRCYIM